MISKLFIENFKRFSHQSLRFEPLTVLAGLNGTGKTSVIHALLLAREAASGTRSDVVPLNGPFGLELGTVEDVVNWNATGDVRISYEARDAEPGGWTLAADSDEALHLRATDVAHAEVPPAFQRRTHTFAYLCAERLGPRTVAPSMALPGEQLTVGVQGEFTVQVLHALGGKMIPNARRHPNEADGEATYLKYAVERWLSEIVRPVEFSTLPFVGTEMLALRVRVPGKAVEGGPDVLASEWVRMPNMGFGVSYALPIVVAGLLAAKGGMLIVENPEAHLHPAGQSRMGFFLAWLAGLGVQVVVETHSDHILNGFRRAIAESKVIKAADAVVHFFDSDDENNSRVTELQFTELGGLSDWPKGFFDQFQTDISSLSRIRRPR